MFIGATARSPIRVHFDQGARSKLKIMSHIISIGANESDTRLQSVIIACDTVNEVFHSLGLIGHRDRDVLLALNQIINSLAMV